MAREIRTGVRDQALRRGSVVERVLGREWRLGWAFVAPIVVLLAVLVLVPFLDSIRLSFTERQLQNATAFVGLKNYVDLWRDKFFLDAARNTVVFTVYSEAFKVALGLIAALLLHNLRRGRTILTGLVLLPWIIPTVVTALSWRSMYDPIFGGLTALMAPVGPLLVHLHLFDSWPVAWLSDPKLAMSSVIIVNVWKGIPFFTINFLAALKAIGADQYEAASVDGANALRRFVHVTLPGLKYVLLIATLLSTIWTFNTFDLIWLLTQGGPGDITAPYVLFAYEKAIQQLQYGPGAAVALMLLPVSAVLVFFLTRYMRRGEDAVANTRVGRALSSSSRWIVAGAALALLAVMFALDRGLLIRAVVLLAVLALLAAAVGSGSDWLTRFKRGLIARLSSRIPLWIAMAVLLVFVLGPLYWIVITAFKTDLQTTTRASIFWPHPWTLDQFRALFASNPFATWYRNTVVVAVASTLVAVVLAAMGGYAIARFRFRGGGALAGTILLTYIMPGALLFIPLYQILSDLHVINSLWALVITYPTFTIPFAAWLLMGYFRSIPIELEEAAMVDGATRLQVLWRVVLPLARPALLAVGLFTLTNAWNEYLFAFVFITNEGLKTLPVGLQSMIVGDIQPWGQLMAASLLISIPVVVVYGYAQRFLVEGLTVGAVKG